MIPQDPMAPTVVGTTTTPNVGGYCPPVRPSICPGCGRCGTCGHPVAPRPAWPGTMPPYVTHIGDPRLIPGAPITTCEVR